MNQTKYSEQVLTDVGRVARGIKPLLIVSEGKDTRAYEDVVTVATALDLNIDFDMLRCEDGKMHEHAFIAGASVQAGERIQKAQRLIQQCREGAISRAYLQLKLGEALGYYENDIVEFIASAKSRECPCDCCGGPFVPEAYFDTPMQGDPEPLTRQGLRECADEFCHNTTTGVVCHACSKRGI